MGETEQDVAKPFVGVVSTWNEAAPCNTALMRQNSQLKRTLNNLEAHQENFVQLQ